MTQDRGSLTAIGGMAATIVIAIAVTTVVGIVSLNQGSYSPVLGQPRPTCCVAERVCPMTRNPRTKRRARGGAAAPCPKCRKPSRVLVTRLVERIVHRRRRCKTCGVTFKTEEVRVK